MILVMWEGNFIRTIQNHLFKEIIIFLLKNNYKIQPTEQNLIEIVGHHAHYKFCRMQTPWAHCPSTTGLYLPKEIEGNKILIN